VRFLDEAAALGARDYYFTGGEPMMHPEFWRLTDEALARGPLTVLTNGILIDADAAARARRAFDRARYSFDLRVSLDGMSPETNDPVRGKGTFARITAGIAELARAGLSPAITVVEHADGMAAEAARRDFLAFARALGLTHPRVKFLPLLRLGREERRTHGYSDDDVTALADHPLSPELLDQLVCSSSRLVTADGVMTCPILLDAPAARLGRTLAETLRPIRLLWAACKTCVVEGLSCRT
jgi:molybdenum cofactor biosynthesis enzyme MoaA